MTPVAGGAARWVRSPEVLWRNGLDGVLLLPPETRQPLELSGLAALFWYAVAEPATLGEAATDLAQLSGRVGDPHLVEELLPVLRSLRRCRAVIPA